MARAPSRTARRHAARSDDARHGRLAGAGARCASRADARHAGRHRDLAALDDAEREAPEHDAFAVVSKQDLSRGDAGAGRAGRGASATRRRQDGRLHRCRYNHRFTRSERGVDERASNMLHDLVSKGTRPEILQRWWTGSWRAPSFRSDRISKTELTEQSRRFLSLFRQASKYGQRRHPVAGVGQRPADARRALGQPGPAGLLPVGDRAVRVLAEGDAVRAACSDQLPQRSEGRGRG